MKVRLCYIISEYDTGADSHYFHIYELLEKVSKQVEILLFVEQKIVQSPPTFCKYYVQKFNSAPLSLLERLVVFSYLNLKGYKNYYTHYSIFSSILSSIVVRLFGGRSSFWYLQMYHLYNHPWWEKIAFEFNLRLVSSLVTGNLAMKSYFQNQFKVDATKISVMPLWINLSRFQRTSVKSARIKTILFVHTLSMRKGADKLVPIAKKVLKSLRMCKLKIVGDGELRNKIEAEIKKNHLGNKIELVGKVSNSEIPKFYSDSNLFLMPSKEEEMGRVLLEAMASGVPIVATDTVGPQTIMSPLQKKFLVDSSDINGFSAKIVQILTNPKLSSRLAQEGKNVVKRYDINRISKIFIAIATEPLDH